MESMETKEEIPGKEQGKQPIYKCSGCGKPHTETAHLILISDTVAICDECVDLCISILAERPKAAVARARVQTQEAQRRVKAAGVMIT